jgi:hypothetical protein
MATEYTIQVLDHLNEYTIQIVIEASLAEAGFTLSSDGQAIYATAGNGYFRPGRIFNLLATREGQMAYRVQENINGRAPKWWVDCPTIESANKVRSLAWTDCKLDATIKTVLVV